jgi:hypothetical protein
VCNDPAAGEAPDYVDVYVSEPDAEDGSPGIQQSLGAHASCLNRVFSVHVETNFPPEGE